MIDERRFGLIAASAIAIVWATGSAQYVDVAPWYVVGVLAGFANIVLILRTPRIAGWNDLELGGRRRDRRADLSRHAAVLRRYRCDARGARRARERPQSVRARLPLVAARRLAVPVSAGRTARVRHCESVRLARWCRSLRWYRDGARHRRARATRRDRSRGDLSRDLRHVPSRSTQCKRRLQRCDAGVLGCRVRRAARLERVGDSAVFRARFGLRAQSCSRSR